MERAAHSLDDDRMPRSTRCGFLRGALDALLPPCCAACGVYGREPFCRVCMEAIEPAPPCAIEGASAVVAVFGYGGPLAIAVRRLKYEGRIDLARSLGASMIGASRSLGPIDVIVPVPVTRSRLLERGYNQARELARAIEYPVDPFALVRVDGGREQVGLGKAARRANAADSFVAVRERVENLRVLLVDDVITTGATARAAVRELGRAGARTVGVVALAHTPQCRA